MKLLTIQFTIAILNALLLFSCEKSEKDEIENTKSITATGYEYEFLDQTLQGKINNTDWTFQMGNLSTYEKTDGTISNSFALNDTIGVDSCSSVYGKTYEKIIFSFKSDQPVEVGKYELMFDFNDWTKNRSVTFVYRENGSVPVNMVATEGIYEITKIDLNKEIIEGRMDVKIDNGNYLNGSFKIKHCSL